MKKSQRLSEMMLYMNRRKKFTVDDLVQYFNVSKRTVLRDITDLYDMGFLLESTRGPHGGYQVIRENVLPPMVFTMDELMAITLAISSLRFFVKLPFETEYETVAKKFYLNLSGEAKNQMDQMIKRVEFQTQTFYSETPFLQKLFHATLVQEVISITYKGTEREIQPIGLYAGYGEWYCIAYCFKREAFRTLL